MFLICFYKMHIIVAFLKQYKYEKYTGVQTHVTEVKLYLSKVRPLLLLIHVSGAGKYANKCIKML